jgi:hypothetical protein
MSAWFALTWRAQLSKGESVLILGATGVTGKLAIQIARRLGAGRVVAAGRNEQVLSTLGRLGADATIRLDQPGRDLTEVFVREAGEAGFDGKLNGNYQDEMGNRFNTRIEGTRIKHTMGPVSIKMYDKFRLILRIETTVVNVSFFKHYRQVEHQDGTSSMAWAEMKKTIYSLAPLRELLLVANRRYLEFISAIEDDKAGTDKLNKISQPVQKNDRAYRGFNFFDPDDEQLFRSLASGEFNISGFQNKDLRRRTNGKNSGQISRTMKRLRVHGLIKKVGHTYKYYLTALGKQVVALGLKLKEIHIIPALCAEPDC